MVAIFKAFTFAAKKNARLLPSKISTQKIH